VVRVDRLNGRINRLRSHDHSRAAPEWVIVAFSVFVFRVIADIGNDDFHFSGLDCPADYALGERREHFGKKGKNVNPHTLQPP